MIEYFQEIFNGLTFFELILLFTFSVLFIIRVLYLFFFTGRVLFRSKKAINDSFEQSLSLILAVRNQEENLKNNLPGLLSLEDINFEMVVVDDYSQDNSYLILGLLKERYKRLKISLLHQETRFSIKLAQNIALKAAQNDWVLTFPVAISDYSPGWLSAMSKVLSEEKNVVVGYSGIAKGSGLFNHLYRIENYFQYLKSVGYILNRIPYVYSDENVAFRKNKYFDIGGYGQKITEPYANLELLINLFIRKKSTVVLFGEESTIKKSGVFGRAEYNELLKKSIRIEKHLTKYKRLILALDEIGKLLFVPAAIIVIVLLSELWVVFISMLAFKFVVNLLIIKITQNRLNERKIFISSLVYDLVIPYLKLLYRWNFNTRNKKNRWRSKV